MGKDCKPTITNQQLQDLLEITLSSNHCKLISTVIMAHLETTPNGMEQFAMSLMGIAPTVTLKPLDEVYVNFNHLQTWRMNKSQMMEAGYLFKDKVRCTVIETNVYQIEPIHVRYVSIDSGGINKFDTMWIQESSAILTDQMKLEEDDPLPF